MDEKQEKFLDEQLELHSHALQDGRYSLSAGLFRATLATAYTYGAVNAICGLIDRLEAPSEAVNAAG